MQPRIWENRWKALDDAIQDVLSTFPTEKTAWEITLESALKCLKAFGKTQFDFFHDGFNNNTLVQSPKYRAEHALRNTLDQIAFDLSALQRARYQRSNLATDTERKALELADKLAYKALKPVIDGGLLGDLKDTAVITYFKKASSVRVVPYAPLALIGIPYTCLDPANNARDFLAIPHEIGHYVFWHAKTKNGSVPLNAWLRSQVPTEPAWRFAWLEEIFADVYGTLIAGPVIAADFQELLSDNLDFDEDDGRHPVAALRPHIYTDTLSKFDSFQIAAYGLEEQWKKRLKKRGSKKAFQPKGATPDTKSIPIEKAREKLAEVIELIVDDILGDVTSNIEANAWSGNLSNPETLFQNFHNAHLADPGPTAAPSLLPPTLVARDKTTASSTSASVMAASVNIPRPLDWEVGETTTHWLKFFSLAQANGVKLMPTTWSALLDGGGWAAGGPETDSDPK